jgi:putative protein-disulfide isomerase
MGDNGMPNDVPDSSNKMEVGKGGLLLTQESTLNYAASAPDEATRQVEVIYYTDPLCSWSWAFEPQWRRLRYEFGTQICPRYVMCGMIADWQSYSDPINSVSRPAQMAPQWFQVRQISGMPIDEQIWLEDPPHSSYPACIAFKAAERQGSSTAEAFLRRMREGVMFERRNISCREVLLGIAEELACSSMDHAGFNFERFRQDLSNQDTLDAFRADVQEARYRGIGRFPTLVLRRRNEGRGLIIVGFRPYAALRLALSGVASDLEPACPIPSLLEYVSYWGQVTAQEAREALDLEESLADQAIQEAVAAGILLPKMSPSGRVYGYSRI